MIQNVYDALRDNSASSLTFRVTLKLCFGSWEPSFFCFPVGMSYYLIKDWNLTKVLSHFARCMV